MNMYGYILYIIIYIVYNCIYWYLWNCYMSRLLCFFFRFVSWNLEMR